MSKAMQKLAKRVSQEPYGSLGRDIKRMVEEPKNKG